MRQEKHSCPQITTLSHHLPLQKIRDSISYIKSQVEFKAPFQDLDQFFPTWELAAFKALLNPLPEVSLDCQSFPLCQGPGHSLPVDVCSPCQEQDISADRVKKREFLPTS